MTFTGRSVAWVAPTSSTRGAANVYIDGVKVAKVNLGTAEHKRRLVYARTFATSSAHTLRIRSLSGKRIDLTRFWSLANRAPTSTGGLAGYAPIRLLGGAQQC